MGRFLACALVVTLAACKSSGGASGTHVSDAASRDAFVLTYGDSACGTCVAKACATSIDACNTTPDCAAYLACLDACPVTAGDEPEPVCAADCVQPTSSSGQVASSQFAQCRTAGAGASCGECHASAPVKDGGKPDATVADGSVKDAGADVDWLHENCPLVDASNSCRQCILEQCCGARAACETDPNCLKLDNCIPDCDEGQPDEAGATPLPPDASAGQYVCDQWCSVKTNPGLGEWARYTTCATTLCAVACGSPSCAQCTQQNCAAEAFASQSTAAGYLMWSCISQCASTDQTCLQQCETSAPASVQTATAAWMTCTEQQCPGCDNPLADGGS
jgi:hypothetical protein